MAVSRSAGRLQHSKRSAGARPVLGVEGPPGAVRPARSGCVFDGDWPPATRPSGGGAPAGHRTRSTHLVRVRLSSKPRALPRSGRPHLRSRLILREVRVRQSSCEGAFGPLLRATCLIPESK
jgi:hypothetical protein